MLRIAATAACLERRQLVNLQRTSLAAVAVCALLAVVGIGGVAAAWGAYLVDSRLETSGPRAAGVVTDKRRVSSGDGDTDHVLEYRFSPSSGVQLVARRNVPRSVWQSVDVGHAIQVVYSEANPNRNFPQGAGVTSLFLTIFVSTLSGGLGLFGAVLLIGVLRRHRPA